MHLLTDEGLGVDVAKIRHVLKSFRHVQGSPGKQSVLKDRIAQEGYDMEAEDIFYST